MFIAYIKTLVLGIISVLLSLYSLGQNITSRLTLGNEGETIFFNFNSFEKYRNGISINTIATVYYIDTTDLGVPTATQWELDVKANRPSLIGDYGNNLSLTYIEIEATGDDVGATYNNPTVLSNSDNVHLIQNGSQTPGSFTTLNITYNVGTTDPLLGEEPDYYYVDIIYTLQPQ